MLLSLLLAAAPMVDLSPYSAKPLPDGSWEYSYDLAGVKSLGASPDAIAAHGEEKVKAFLKGLPRNVKLHVQPVAIDVSAGRGVEAGALPKSFALVSDKEIDSDNPLAKKSVSKLRAPLDPAEPKLLLPVEAVAWVVRQTEVNALLAEEMELEPQRREFWTRVMNLALGKHTGAAGDVKEGALVLAARVAAGLACLDRTKVLAAARADADASLATDADISRLSEAPGALLAPVPWNSKPELSCAWVRGRVLAQPFERSRAGSAAVLLFLQFLQKDPKLLASWEKIRARRDAFLGAPQSELITVWKDKTQGDAERALTDLSAFLEALPDEQRVPPGLLGAPSTAFSRFLDELVGAERRESFAELANAVGDGRVKPAQDTFANEREAWLAPMCGSDQSNVHYDGDWRDRLQVAFITQLGGSAEGRSRGEEIAREDGEKSLLQVRLLVPPSLDVEPAPDVYARAAASLEKLVKALNAAQLGRLTGDAVALAPKLKSLAALADPARATSKEAVEARRWAATWKLDPRFGQDVREEFASPVAMPGERLHAGVVGVSRRELAVTFTAPPKVTVVGDVKGVVTEASEQRYIVPVLVTVGTSAPEATQALDKPTWRALVDGAGRDAQQVEGVFAETLHK